MKRIESLLRRTIGLDVASVGPTTLERVVRRRMKALGFNDLAAYFAYVSSTLAEWEELLEAVVVTETWFFRDQSPFKAFVQLAQEALLPPRDGPLRVLSIPCSTGEEPYSLAMALRDAGVVGQQFTIEAVDISARVLARAQRGLYGKNSFRGKTLDFRDRYFTTTEQGFQIHPAVHESVRFERGNLLEPTFVADRAPCDFVFCRNLLIYYDRETQRRALQCLRQLLKPSGVLFVGPAELPLVLDHGFAPVALPMSFACRQASPESSVQSPKSDSDRPQSRVLTADSGLGTGDCCLTAARALADAGQLEQAAALCQAQVKERGPSAAAYYLLGLVCDAAGDPAAMDYYRKALYLEPDHYETLLQMALLLERDGDSAGAKTFKRRAARLEPKQ